MGQPQEEGLGEEHLVEDWKNERKNAFMLSGCRDDQTPSDANIDGSNVGVMSWATPIKLIFKFVFFSFQCVPAKSP